MTNKDAYNTHAAVVSPIGITLYCYNSNRISMMEFVDIENRALIKAMQRQWRLFILYEPIYNDVNSALLKVGYN